MQRVTIVARLALLGACTHSPPSPILTRVDPGVITGDSATALTITGQNFFAKATVNAATPSRSKVIVDFKAVLVHRTLGTMVPLDDVRLMSATSLRATAPGNLDVGEYDLLVTDPRQRVTPKLEHAIEKSTDVLNPPSTVIKLVDLPPGQDVREFSFTPDGTAIVYISDKDFDDVFELYVVNVTTAETRKLNGTLVPGGDVARFEISDDSQYVLYVADEATDDLFELYTSTIVGAQRARVNPLMSPGGQIEQAVFAADNTVVYVADNDTPGDFEYYAANPDGSSLRKFNGPGQGGSTGYSGFILSPDKTRIVYASTERSPTDTDLYVADLAGTQTSQVNPTIVGNGSAFLTEAQFTFDNQDIVYSANSNYMGVTDMFVALGASGSIRNISQLSSGDAHRSILSSDGKYLVYGVREYQVGLHSLYSSPLDGSAPAVRMHEHLITGEVAGSFRMTEDSQYVVYVLRRAPEHKSNLFLVGIDGIPVGDSASATPSVGSVTTFETTGHQVVYLAPQFDADILELMVVNLDTFERYRLHAALSAGQGVESFLLTPDGSHVIFLADLVAGTTELYSVPLSGPPINRVNDGISAGGDVAHFELSPNGSSVAYLADVDNSGSLELFYKTDFKAPGVGSTAPAPIERLDDADPRLVARYYLSEAAVGMAPVEVVDSATAPLNIPLVTGGNLAYATGAAGRGLDWAFLGGDGSAVIPIDGTKLHTRLHDRTSCTLETVVEVEAADDSTPRLVYFGESTSSGVLSLHYSSPRNHTGSVLMFFFGTSNADPVRFYTRLEGRGRVVVTVAVDTTLSDPSQRIKLYLDGVPMPAQYGENVPDQFRTTDLSSGLDFRIGNRRFNERSIDGRIYYVALYDEALDASEVRHHAKILLNSDD
ncbi:MAG: LamG-like jellyroll fold domain-containing protein [Myxococcota bacterium]